jgi:hypothetical protein
MKLIGGKRGGGKQEVTNGGMDLVGGISHAEQRSSRGFWELRMRGETMRGTQALQAWGNGCGGDEMNK